ncbi:helix-turn-helix domain-containing protein [Mycolicibacterium lutetiense]
MTPDDTCTLQKLVDDPSLRLELALQPVDPHIEIRGHHTTDLDRPARYLLPGELLLTNGLWLHRKDASGWVSEANVAGIAALAFGLNDDWPELPPSLLRACRAVGLPLVVVPADLSFSLVTDLIDNTNARLDPARLQLNRVRRLQQRVAGETAHSELLALLTRETGLRCWLVGRNGRIIEGPEAPPDSSILRSAARAGRIGRLSGPLDSGYTGFPIDPRRPNSSLALVVDCALADFTDDARLVVETIMPSLFTEHAERRARDGMRGSLVRELLELVWMGGISRPAYAARLRAMGFNSRRAVAVLASTNELPDLADAADGVESQCCYTSFSGMNVLLVQSDSPDVVDEIAALISEGGVNPVLGAGNPGQGPEGLRRSLSEAMPACRIAQTRQPGDQVVRRVDVGSYIGLLHFVDYRTLGAFKSALLSPLIEWDREHDANLVATLQTFIENNGKWRQTARILHIHPTTLKYRAERIEALTGRNLEHLDSRIDFALAFAVAPFLEYT